MNCCARLKALNQTLLIALLASASACASAKVNFTSAPGEAEIYAAPAGSKDQKKIGVTPYSVASSELLEQLGGTGPIWIEMRKTGYVSSRALITDISNLEVSLQLELTPQSGLEEMDRLNVLMDQLFEAQRLAKAGRTDDAMAKIKEVQKSAPQLAAAYELEGGVLFVQKKFKESLDAYSTAARYNPKNPEVLKMKTRLQTSLQAQPGGAP